MKNSPLRFFYFTLPVIIILSGFADLRAAEVTIGFVRKAGQQYKLTIRKTTYRSRPGLPATGATTMTPITVKVISAFKDGYDLEWTFGEVRFEERAANADKKALHKILAGQMKGMRVRFRVDRKGTVKEILNKSEITRRYQRLYERLYKQARKKGLASGPEQFKTSLPPGTLSPAGIQAQVLENYNLMNQPIGATFPLKGTVRQNISMPSIVPGKKLPAVAASSAKAWDAIAGILDYRVQIVYDKGPLNRAVSELVKRQYRALGKKIPAGFKLPPGSLEETLDYRIETGEGFVMRVLYVKDIRIQGAVRKNTTEILLRTLPQ